MNNRYMKLLEQLTVDQLQREANKTCATQPEKTTLVYDQLIDRVADFNEKLRYQRLSNRYESQAKEYETKRHEVA